MPKSYPKFRYSDWEWIAVSFPPDRREDMARAAWLITQCSPDEIEECIREQKSDPRVIIPLCLIEFTDEINWATSKISSRCKKLLRCLSLEILEVLHRKLKNNDRYITRNDWKNFFQPNKIGCIEGFLLLFSLLLYIVVVLFTPVIILHTLYDVGSLEFWLFVVLTDITLAIINIYYNSLKQIKSIHYWINFTFIIPFTCFLFLSFGTILVSFTQSIFSLFLPKSIIIVFLALGTILTSISLLMGRGNWGIIVTCWSILLIIFNAQIIDILGMSITLETFWLILYGILVGFFISLMIIMWKRAKPKQVKIQIITVFLFLYFCWSFVICISFSIFLLQFFSGLQIVFICIFLIGIGVKLWIYTQDRIRISILKAMEISKYCLENKPSQIPVSDDKNSSKLDQEFLNFLSILEDK